MKNNIIAKILAGVCTNNLNNKKIDTEYFRN